MGLSYLGVLLVFGREWSAGGAQAGLGAALVFGSAITYAIYLLASGEVVKRIGSLRLTGLATAVACVLCIAQYLLLRPWDSALGVAPQVVSLSVLNAVLCTFAPVLMVMMAIERLGPALTAQAGMIGPMSTIAMGVLLLGEPFTGWVVVGTALVLVGVWLVMRPR
jgi:drug/metabolite transporter (DMT)-like permease